MNQRTVVFPFAPTFIDYPDNESLAILLFIMGCERNCKDCHNPEFKDEMYTANNTKLVTVEECLYMIINACLKQKTNKIVLTGGDPLFPNTIEFTKELLEKLKEAQFEVVIYTAYNVDYVKKQNIKNFTFLKTGEYLSEQKQLGYKTDEEFVLASKNQKIYDKNYKLLTNNGILKFK